MKKYKVTVIKLRGKRSFQVPDDGIFLTEGDVMCGYSQEEHAMDKYFDVWFNNPKNLDSLNYVTLGRIQKVEEDVYTTKIGVFKIQEVSDGKILGNNNHH